MEKFKELKKILDYKNKPCVILNKDFCILYTNKACLNLFKEGEDISIYITKTFNKNAKLDIKDFKSETTILIMKEDTRYPVIITPFFDEEDKEKYYIGEFFTEKDSKELFDKMEVKKHLHSNCKSTKDTIGKIFAINHIIFATANNIENLCKTIPDDNLVLKKELKKNILYLNNEKQAFSNLIEKAYNNLTNMGFILEKDNNIEDTSELINPTEVISQLQEVLNEVVKGRRRINFFCDKGCCFIRMPLKSFIGLMVNVLTNAIIYSPTNGEIFVSFIFNNSDDVVIKVKNQIDPQKCYEIETTENSRAKNGLFAAKTITVKANGQFFCKETFEDGDNDE